MTMIPRCCVLVAALALGIRAASAQQTTLGQLCFNADLIAKGCVEGLSDRPPTQREATFRIEETLKGTAQPGARAAILFFPALAHDARLEVSDQGLVLFLSAPLPSGERRVLGGEAGAVAVSAANDARLQAARSLLSAWRLADPSTRRESVKRACLSALQSADRMLAREIACDLMRWRQTQGALNAAERESLARDMSALPGADPALEAIIDLLAGSDDQELAPFFVVRLARGGSDITIEACIRALERLDGVNSEPALLMALASDDPAGRRGALLALARLGKAASREAVLGALDDPDLEIREAAYVAAGSLGFAQSRPKLLAALSADEGRLSYAAAFALLRLGDGASVEAVRKRRDGLPDGALRRSLTALLGNPGSRGFSPLSP